VLAALAAEITAPLADYSESIASITSTHINQFCVRLLDVLASLYVMISTAGSSKSILLYFYKCQCRRSFTFPERENM